MGGDCNATGNESVAAYRGYGLGKRRCRLISIRIMALFLVLR